MSQIKRKLLFASLLIALLHVQVDCCDRENFHYIKISAQETHVEDKKFRLYHTAEKWSNDPLIFPSEEVNDCDKIQEYEEALKEARSIKICNYLIPVLRHGDVQNLENLEDINLAQNSIEEVQPGTFLNVPVLNIISLSYNNIKEIYTGVFNNLNVSALFLENNHISNIATAAFDNMTNLRQLELGNNKLKTWNVDWFTNSPNIRTVSASFNELTELPARAFNNVRNAIEVITLSNNKIDDVDSAAFEELNHLVGLNLGSNNIACLSEKLLEGFPPHLHLQIEYNLEMNCSCLNKIKKWARNRENIFVTNVLTVEKYVEGQCTDQVFEISENAVSEVSDSEEIVSGSNSVQMK